MDRARFAFVLSIAWGAAILAGIIAVYLTIVGPAAAQGAQCGKWDEVQAGLIAAGFHKAAIGLDDHGVAITVFETEGGERWAMFTVNPDGTRACLFAGGSAWFPIAPPEPPVPGRRPA